MFDKIDTNKSGFLESSNLASCLLEATGTKPTDEEILYMISGADQDNDGKIDFEEFCLIVDAKETLEAKNLPVLADLHAWAGTDPVKKKCVEEKQVHLVIPSTGNIGFMTVQALARVGTNFTVKCGIRPGQSNSAVIDLLKSLGEETGFKNVETVVCDYTDPQSLVKAMQGVDRVLTYTPTVGMARWAETQKRVAEAAKQTGVKCLYWITGQQEVLDPKSFWVKNQTECVNIVRAVGVPLVEIRPNKLISNLYGMRDSIMKTGLCYCGYNSSAKVVMTHPTDVAQLAACLMVLPVADHQGKHYAVTGPKPYSMDEECHLLSNAIKAEEKKGCKRMAFRDNLLQVFNEVDKDGSGFLDVGEMKAALEPLGYSPEQARLIFKEAASHHEKNLRRSETTKMQLSANDFVTYMGEYFRSKAAEKDARRVTPVTLDSNGFMGYAKGAGMDDDSIKLMLSLFECINSGWGGENAVDVEDFTKIVGRAPLSPEAWVKENVGAFMASHWDVVRTHARKDMLLKAAWQ